MHELSLCYSLLQQVDTVRREQRATRVTTIRVSLGPLSGVVPDLLSAAFEIAVSDTAIDGAALVITSRPVRVHCRSCDHEAEVPPQRLLCPRCGEWRTRVISGEEMLLERVELEIEDEEESCHV